MTMKRRAQLIFANVVNDADIGMIQSRGGACFPLKPFQRGRDLGA